MLVPIPAPAWAGHKLSYRSSARAKRSFQTVLDAADLLVDGAPTLVELASDPGGGVTLDVHVPLKGGRIHDRVVHAPGLKLSRLERRVTNGGGVLSREEIVDFSSPTHALPQCTYVEVSMPFLIGAQPFDKTRRSIYAWICDRFVAKVYYESTGITTVRVPAGEFKTQSVILYPDLNDWVSLPSIITKLSKPFLPKYHMWYEADAPHRLVKFEGPYGPPGAPEIVLELA